MDLIGNCQKCYPFKLSQYPTTIVIKAQLSANTSYIVKVYDKFGNRYSFPAATTDAQHNLNITVPDTFPPAWFNRDSGVFKFEISLHAQPWIPVDLYFGTEIYTCIAVEFVLDGSNINTIQ